MLSASFANMSGVTELPRLPVAETDEEGEERLKDHSLVIKGSAAMAALLLLWAGGCSLPNLPTIAGEESQTVTPVYSSDEASAHVGELATVYGPVISGVYARFSPGKRTILTVGEAVQDARVFQVVIEGDDRGKFPTPLESVYIGRTIYVTGRVTEDRGIPLIEVDDPAQIEQR